MITSNIKTVLDRCRESIIQTRPFMLMHVLFLYWYVNVTVRLAILRLIYQLYNQISCNIINVLALELKKKKINFLYNSRSVLLLLLCNDGWCAASLQVWNSCSFIHPLLNTKVLRGYINLKSNSLVFTNSLKHVHSPLSSQPLTCEENTPAWPADPSAPSQTSTQCTRDQGGIQGLEHTLTYS